MVDALASGVSVHTDVGFKSPSHHNPRRYCSHWAKVAELVDALASGVSVLTDVGVQVPPLAPTRQYPKKEYCAKVAELVDALASGVSVLRTWGFKSPLAPIFFLPTLSSQLDIHHHQHYPTNQCNARWQQDKMAQLAMPYHHRGHQHAHRDQRPPYHLTPRHTERQSTRRERRLPNRF